MKKTENYSLIKHTPNLQIFNKETPDRNSTLFVFNREADKNMVPEQANEGEEGKATNKRAE